MATTASTDVTALPGNGDVSVLAVEGLGPRESSLLVNLITQCVLQRTLSQKRADQSRTPEGSMPLVFVVGADHLSYETISLLSRRVRQAGVRTAFLFSRLEEDSRRLLGSDGSDTVFLQLQPHEEAQFAAEFIGKRHRFVLSQITKSVGDSLGGSRGQNRAVTQTSSDTSTDSRSSGKGATYGWFVANSKNRSDSKSWSASHTQSYAETVGTQWSETWQKTDTYGETAARVYEYDTEPRAIQELDASSFVYVSRAGGRTRIAAGDCNPGLEHPPYAAPYPREDCPHRK